MSVLYSLITITNVLTFRVFVCLLIFAFLLRVHLEKSVKMVHIYISLCTMLSRTLHAHRDV